jgi:transposase
VNTIGPEVTDGRRRRRTHSREFKAQAVAACRAPGVSLSAIALMNGINANLLRRWLIAADQASGLLRKSSIVAPSLSRAAAQDTFVAVPLPTSVAPCDIRIDVQRGGDAIKVSWPVSAASECALFLRDLLK